MPAGASLAREIELIRESVEAYAQGGVAAAAEYLDDDVELTDAGLFATAATYRGKAEVVAFLGKIATAFEDIRLDPIEFIECPPAVVVPIRLSAHNGKLQMIATSAYWFRDGKVIRLETFRSRAAALRALEARAI